MKTSQSLPPRTHLKINNTTPPTRTQIQTTPSPEGPEDRLVPTKLGEKLAGVGMVAGAGLGAAQVAGQALAAGGLLAGAGTLALGAGGFAAGFAAADFASGLFHHWIDNYPDQNTPVVGEAAYRFQVHHHEVHDLEKQTIWSNMGLAGRFTAIPMLAAALINPPAAVLGAAAGFLTGAYVAQASHRWTHQNHPPETVKKLQDLHVLQSKQDHLAHHRQPYSGNYCIVNGMCNPLLEKVNFWRNWERTIHQVTGAEPNTWRNPGIKDYALGKIDREEMLKQVKANRKAFEIQDKADYQEMKKAYVEMHGHD